jgi:hypothetical protein
VQVMNKKLWIIGIVGYLSYYDYVLPIYNIKSDEVDQNTTLDIIEEGYNDYETEEPKVFTYDEVRYLMENCNGNSSE